MNSSILSFRSDGLEDQCIREFSIILRNRNTLSPRKFSALVGSSICALVNYCGTCAEKTINPGRTTELTRMADFPRVSETGFLGRSLWSWSSGRMLGLQRTQAFAGWVSNIGFVISVSTVWVHSQAQHVPFHANDLAATFWGSIVLCQTVSFLHHSFSPLLHRPEHCAQH